MDETSTSTAEAAIDPRRGPRRRWLVVGGLILLVLVILVTVWRLAGGGDLQRLARAPDATLAAGTSRVALIGTVEDLPLVGAFTLTVGEGELDLAERRAHLRREVPGVSEVPLLNRLLPESVEILHDGRDIYLRLPVDGERAWVRLADDDPDRGLDTSTPDLTNPAAALGLLRVLDGMPEVIDDDVVVRGQPSTRFRVRVDLEEAAEAVSGSAEDVARKLRRLHGRRHMPLDVWLDSTDRVTRLRYILQSELSGGVTLTVITDLELWDFGTAVDIETPDAIGSVSADRLREFDPFARLREIFGR